MIFFLIFFICFLIRVDRETFPKTKLLNNLNCEFEDYLDVTNTLLQNCQHNPSEFKITLIINQNQEAILSIFGKNDIKEYLIFSFNFVKIPNNLSKSSVAFQYSCLNTEVEILEKRLINIMKIVKWKNPALFLMLKNFVDKNN